MLTDIQTHLMSCSTVLRSRKLRGKEDRRKGVVANAQATWFLKQNKSPPHPHPVKTDAAQHFMNCDRGREELLVCNVCAGVKCSRVGVGVGACVCVCVCVCLYARVLHAVQALFCCSDAVRLLLLLQFPKSLHITSPAQCCATPTPLTRLQGGRSRTCTPESCPPHPVAPPK
jgi:hypothetical protein